MTNSNPNNPIASTQIYECSRLHRGGTLKIGSP